MISHFRLLLEGPDQAVVLGAAAVAFVLLAALGRVVAGPRALPEATIIYGWSAAVAAFLVPAVLFGVGFAATG
jgi:hypothetical protein